LSHQVVCRVDGAAQLVLVEELDWEERGRALLGVSKQSVNESMIEHEKYMYKSRYE
jgi:hypothetical protein